MYMNAEAFIKEFGYLGIFLATFVQAELTLLVGGILANQGLFSIAGVILAGFLSGMTSDIVFFYTGRQIGLPVLKKLRLENKAFKISRYIDRYRIPLLLTYRIFYGFRTATTLLFGISKTNQKTYIVFTILGNIFWAIVFVYLGIYFGNYIIPLLPNVYTLPLALAVLIVIIVIYLAVKYYKLKNN